MGGLRIVRGPTRRRRKRAQLDYVSRARKENQADEMEGRGYGCCRGLRRTKEEENRGRGGGKGKNV
jgi:hypothetical protein